LDTAVDASSLLCQLEARLSRLERAVGHADAASGVSCGAVIPAVQQLEHRLSLLDDAAFQELGRRAKLLAAELDGGHAGSSASPLKRGVASPSAGGGGGGGGGSSAISSANLATMMDTLQRWDAVAQDLPAIVDRLQSLRILHEEAALFTYVAVCCRCCARDCCCRRC
jgi:nuclear migration protein JNM1